MKKTPFLFLVSFKAMTLFFILLVGVPTLSHAQSAKDALMALKKLEARIQGGVTYRDYGSALGEAKFPLNLYFESSEAKKYSDLSSSLRNAMYHYDVASRVWEFKMGRPPSRGRFINVNSDLGKYLEKSYPNVKTDALSELKIFGKDSTYDADLVLRLIWKDASKEVDNATIEYAKLEEKPSDETAKLKKEIAELKKEVAELKEENDLLKNPQKVKKGR